jgi:carbamoyl-phosphate synthase large subunit
VKEAVLPFNRFPGVDTVLGPEMRSTGEVMGIDVSAPLAFAKAQMAAGTPLPTSGTVFISLADADKAAGVDLAQRLRRAGFTLAATTGTASSLRAHGVEVTHEVGKVSEGASTVSALSLLEAGDICLVINTPTGSGGGAQRDGAIIRTTAVQRKVPCLTTMRAALAAVEAMSETSRLGWTYRSLQELHA